MNRDNEEGDDGLQSKKFYRKNVVYRSIRSVGAKAVKSAKKNFCAKLVINPINQRMKYRSQLNDSTASCESPAVKNLTRKSKCRASLDSSYLSSTASEGDIDGTPSKRKLITTTESRSKKNVSRSKKNVRTSKQRIGPKRNLGLSVNSLDNPDNCSKKLSDLAIENLE